MSTPLRPPPGRRADYHHFDEITTRWHDNDIYGHVNNVVYYAWFDTAVNGFLVRRDLLSLAASPIVGIVVENSCRYHASISFPERIEVGLRVGHLGTSAVRYELGVFARATSARRPRGISCMSMSIAPACGRFRCRLKYARRSLISS